MAQKRAAMKRILTFLFATATLTGLATAKPVVKTYTKIAPKAKLTVVHAGAGWNEDSNEMRPEWQKFEKKFTGKVTLVNINTERTDTPEFTKYGPVLSQEHGLPLTFWFSSSGQVLSKHMGNLTSAQLEKETNHQLGLDKPTKAKPKPKSGK